MVQIGVYTLRLHHLTILNTVHGVASEVYQDLLEPIHVYIYIHRMTLINASI